MVCCIAIMRSFHCVSVVISESTSIARRLCASRTSVNDDYLPDL